MGSSAISVIGELLGFEAQPNLRWVSLQFWLLEKLLGFEVQPNLLRLLHPSYDLTQRPAQKVPVRGRSYKPTAFGSPLADRFLHLHAEMAAGGFSRNEYGIAGFELRNGYWFAHRAGEANGFRILEQNRSPFRLG
jgi:hypothetical protein